MKYIIIDPVYQELGFKVLKSGNFHVTYIEYKKFPDGEIYVRFLDDINGKDLTYITTGYPDQNSSILRALLIINTAKDLGASRIRVVFAYFPYGRQDKRFLSGEAISARIIAKALIDTGADEIITIDVHSEDVFKNISFVNIKTIDIWTDFIKNLEKPFLIAPDKGREPFIKEIAQKIDAEYVVFEKKRDLTTGKIIGHKPKDPEKLEELSKTRKTCVIIDDIISTGGTAANIVKEIRKNFNGQIITAFTHGLFLPGSVTKLTKAGTNKIIATDTVKNNFAELTVSKLISHYLEES